jgi:putative alpha-1,2-mannosidase
MNTLRLLLIVCLLGAASTRAASPPPVTLANPLQGTDSNSGYSHGNEYPAIALPFPMNTWAPYTRPASDSFYYQYRDTKIRGIRQTHQPSPWIGDYAAFALMPVSGKLAFKEDDRASTFRHEDETAQPSYYRVHLDTWKTVAEVTPTERCARFRFTYEQPGDAYVVLDAFPGDSSVEIIPAENKVIGISRFNHGGVPKGFANYFVIVFDRPFSAYGVWSPDSVQPGVTNLAGKHAGAFLKFDTSAGTRVGCKVASSFISPEQALRNLQREVGDADFATLRRRASPDRRRHGGPAAHLLQRPLPQHPLSAPLLRVQRKRPPRLFQPLRRQGARRRALYRQRLLGHLPRRPPAV